MPGHAIHNPFCWVGLLVIIAATITVMPALLSQRETRAFIASNALLVGLLATGSAAIFPVMLYSTLAPENSLTANAVASSQSALHLAAIWWPLAFALAGLRISSSSRDGTRGKSVSSGTVMELVETRLNACDYRHRAVQSSTRPFDHNEGRLRTRARRLAAETQLYWYLTFHKLSQC